MSILLVGDLLWKESFVEKDVYSVKPSFSQEQWKHDQHFDLLGGLSWGDVADQSAKDFYAEMDRRLSSIQSTKVHTNTHTHAYTHSYKNTTHTHTGLDAYV